MKTYPTVTSAIDALPANRRVQLNSNDYALYFVQQITEDQVAEMFICNDLANQPPLVTLFKSCSVTKSNFTRNEVYAISVVVASLFKLAGYTSQKQVTAQASKVGLTSATIYRKGE